MSVTYIQDISEHQLVAPVVNYSKSLFAPLDKSSFSAGAVDVIKQIVMLTASVIVYPILVPVAFVGACHHLFQKLCHPARKYHPIDKIDFEFPENDRRGGWLITHIIVEIATTTATGDGVKKESVSEAVYSVSPCSGNTMRSVKELLESAHSQLTDLGAHQGKCVRAVRIYAHLPNSGETEKDGKIELKILYENGKPTSLARCINLNDPKARSFSDMDVNRRTFETVLGKICDQNGFGKLEIANGTLRISGKFHDERAFEIGSTQLNLCMLGLLKPEPKVLSVATRELKVYMNLKQIATHHEEVSNFALNWKDPMPAWIEELAMFYPPSCPLGYIFSAALELKREDCSRDKAPIKGKLLSSIEKEIAEELFRLPKPSKDNLSLEELEEPSQPILSFFALSRQHAEVIQSYAQSIQ